MQEINFRMTCQSAFGDSTLLFANGSIGLNDRTLFVLSIRNLVATVAGVIGHPKDNDSGTILNSLSPRPRLNSIGGAVEVLNRHKIQVSFKRYYS